MKVKNAYRNSRSNSIHAVNHTKVCHPHRTRGHERKLRKATEHKKGKNWNVTSLDLLLSPNNKVFIIIIILESGDLRPPIEIYYH